MYEHMFMLCDILCRILTVLNTVDVCIYGVYLPKPTYFQGYYLIIKQYAILKLNEGESRTSIQDWRSERSQRKG